MEDRAVELITKLRAKMKAKVLDEMDQFFLRKRAIVKLIDDQLKNISQIEHSRHRSLFSFMVNLLGGLITYCHQPTKLFLNLHFVFLPVS
jgi:hypothetical protein